MFKKKMLTDHNIAQCYLKCLIDVKFSPRWVTECDWINNFSGASCEPKFEHSTFLYLSEDRKSVLYASKIILAYDEITGFPWATVFKNRIHDLIPGEEIKCSYLYPGLFVSEYKYLHEVSSLSEYIKRHTFNGAIIVKYIDKIIEMTSTHVFPLCFSEELILVDEENEDMFCCSYNYLVHFSHPISERARRLFSNRVHPTLLTATYEKKPKYPLVDSLLPPSKMKMYCAKVIEKEALKDTRFYICSLIYFLGSLATYWKLGIKWPPLAMKKKMTSRKYTKKNCSYICSFSKVSSFVDIREKIHEYMCNRVLRKLPLEFSGSSQTSTPIYLAYKSALSELKIYIEGLDHTDGGR